MFVVSTTISIVSWDRIGLILAVMVIGGAIGAFARRPDRKPRAGQ